MAIALDERVSDLSDILQNVFIGLYRLWIQTQSVTAWPLVWSSGRSSWLQIQRSGFDFLRYQIFWEVVGLERGPLSLVSIIQELLGRKISGSGLEIREYGRRDLSRWPHRIPYPQMLALTSPTSGSRSVGIVRSRTQTTEFCLVLVSQLTR
jgi:hypothetical protein